VKTIINNFKPFLLIFWVGGKIASLENCQGIYNKVIFFSLKEIRSISFLGFVGKIVFHQSRVPNVPILTEFVGISGKRIRRIRIWPLGNKKKQVENSFKLLF